MYYFNHFLWYQEEQKKWYITFVCFLLLKRNEIGKSLGFDQPFWDPTDCCLPGSSIHGIFKENSLMELLELLRRKLIGMKFLKSY